MTNLKAECPGYGTVWFDPQAMTNVLSFGNIAKQYPIQYLQELDTFQVQLSDCRNILAANRLIIYTFSKDTTFRRISKTSFIPRKCFPSTGNITCPNY